MVIGHHDSPPVITAHELLDLFSHGIGRWWRHPAMLWTTPQDHAKPEIMGMVNSIAIALEYNHRLVDASNVRQPADIIRQLPSPGLDGPFLVEIINMHQAEPWVLSRLARLMLDREITGTTLDGTEEVVVYRFPGDSFMAAWAYYDDGDGPKPSFPNPIRNKFTHLAVSPRTPVLLQDTKEPTANMLWQMQGFVHACMDVNNSSTSKVHFSIDLRITKELLDTWFGNAYPSDWFDRVTDWDIHIATTIYPGGSRSEPNNLISIFEGKHKTLRTARSHRGADTLDFIKGLVRLGIQGDLNDLSGRTLNSNNREGGRAV